MPIRDKYSEAALNHSKLPRNSLEHKVRLWEQILREISSAPRRQAGSVVATGAGPEGFLGIAPLNRGKGRGRAVP